MKYKQILSFFAGACLMFSSLQAQEYNLTKFPKGSTPLEVGNRIANKFIVHSAYPFRKSEGGESS